MSNFKDGLLQMAKYIDDSENAAFDLWTRLPSYKEAEKYHGDYSSEFKPDPQFIMKEACKYISDLLEGSIDEHEPYYRCPCENDHHPDIDTEEVVKAVEEGKTEEEIAEYFETEPHIIRNIVEYSKSG